MTSHVPLTQVFKRQLNNVLLAAIVISGFTIPRPAFAQTGRELIGGLLRDLLESEIERRRRKDERQPNRPLFVPSGTGQQPKIVVSPKSGQARGYFETFSSESRRLAERLQREARTVPGVRAHLSDILKLRSRADLLNRRYATAQPDHVLIQDIQALDSDWRSAAYSSEPVAFVK